MKYLLSSVALLAAGAAFIAVPAYAQTATANLGVSLVVEAECTIAVDPLDFGTVGIIDAAIEAQTDLTVTCTGGTPYSVSLSAGAGLDATTAIRILTDAIVTTNTVNYELRQESFTGAIWGEGADAVDVAAADAGETIIPVFGVIPVQTASVGNYADTVVATITYGAGI